MKKILILFAHPAFKRSKVNAKMRKAVENLEGITLRDLYAIYPDFLIDVAHEKQLCKTHDIIIFQHPFYWYSAPSILREWMDLVFEHGWAYGKHGKVLKDKIFLQALTAGGDHSTYQSNGINLFTIRELTSPYQAAANSCQMVWLPPFVVFGVHQGLSEEELAMHAESYKKTLITLRDEKIDIEKAQKTEFINKNLDTITIKE